MTSGVRTRLRCETGREITAETALIGSSSSPASSGGQPAAGLQPLGDAVQHGVDAQARTARTAGRYGSAPGSWPAAARRRTGGRPAVPTGHQRGPPRPPRPSAIQSGLRQRQQEHQQGRHARRRSRRCRPRRGATPPRERCPACARRRVRGIQRTAMASAIRASGTLTKNTVRQPQAPTSTPPIGSPTAARDHAGDQQAAEHAAGRRVQPGLLGAPADQQHRRGIPGRGAHPDQHPGHDEAGQVLGEPADQAAGQHEQDAGQEHPARPELLGQLPRGRLGDRSWPGTARRPGPRSGRPETCMRGGDRHQRGGDQRAVDRVQRRTQEHRRHEPPGEGVVRGRRLTCSDVAITGSGPAARSTAPRPAGPRAPRG